jgi:hypothetical protein
MAAALATPQAKAFFNAEVPPGAKEAGFLSRGAMVMPREPTDARIAVALHSSFEDRIANEVWIEVDPKTGAVYADDAKVTTDAAVVRACR